VLLMAAGRGSSSGSATLAEALRLGVGPAAILLLRREGIVIVGAVAAELYGLLCPVALVASENWAQLAAAARLEVRAEVSSGGGQDGHRRLRRLRSRPTRFELGSRSSSRLSYRAA
jgi:predicted aconitase with swiveling domain